MKIEFINNTGVTNLGIELESQAKNCLHFNIATVFITKEAINVINIFLKNNRNSVRTGRLIIGLYNRFNSKEIISELQRLSKSSRGKLLVKISKTEKFHWKYYDFQGVKNRCVYNGSANFTDAGMYQVGELQTKITLTKADKKLNENCDQLYASEWENALDIGDFPVDKYNAFIWPKGMIGKLDPAIRKLLTSKPAETITKDLVPVRLIKIYGFLLQSTVTQISLNQSHWDKNKWMYFVCGSRREYNNFSLNDCLFAINKEGKTYTFELIIVKGKCEAKTKDGNYFIAYVSTTRMRKETQVLKTTLYDIGINYSKRGDLDKKLTKSQSAAIKNIFKLGNKNH